MDGSKRGPLHFRDGETAALLSVLDGDSGRVLKNERAAKLSPAGRQGRTHHNIAGVAKLVDALALGASGQNPWEFESPLRHFHRDVFGHEGSSSSLLTIHCVSSAIGLHFVWGRATQLLVSREELERRSLFRSAERNASRCLDRLCATAYNRVEGESLPAYK